MDILAYVSRAEASSAPAKIAVCIVTLNIYGWQCAGLLPGVRQGGRQRVSTNVPATAVTALDMECAATARQLWQRGIRLSGARACYEPAAQDRLYAKKIPGYTMDSAKLHSHWLATGERLVLERWGWRFYASHQHSKRSQPTHDRRRAEWQTERNFLSWLGVNYSA